MTDGRPLWRQLFDIAERSLGGPLEEHLDTPEFRTRLASLIKVQRSVTGSVEGALTRSFHLFGAPALSDVRAVSGGIGRLERRVRDLTREVEDLRTELKKQAR